MRFQRRLAANIVAPKDSEITPSPKPQPDGTLVKALARAWRWQRMLDAGVYASVSEQMATRSSRRTSRSRTAHWSRRSHEPGRSCSMAVMTPR
jgi:hypothetical protein